ncbi:MAG TPA: SDR family oxidoreductase [Candidatus Binataceae bacterium]|jgi:NAD(P)-dependent dehydrogenase (short-subunit alcohol dehydrogenase family)|nr:SDR family oxidoreductase [Candidatus Binataceae bacterium]
MGRLDGKVAVITGAASGMGRATALRFAREGAAVVVADLNSQGAEAVTSEIAAGGGRAVFQRTDVVSEDAIQAMIERAVKEFGRLDITFNNAGIGGATGRLEDIKGEDWDKTFAVLTRAVFFGIKHSIPPMRRGGGGSIISTSSLAGLRGVAGIHAYSAAKAAVVNLTESAAIELGRDRIRVNCICPGGILTPLVYRGMPGGEEAAARNLARMQPIPRPGRPEDIAAMALFLASDESEWITGTAMAVDGGLNTGNVRINFGSGFSGPSFERRERQ